MGDHFDQREALHAQGSFDQRPGDLEATRNLPRGIGDDHRGAEPVLAVTAARNAFGAWRVAILCEGFVMASLAPADAEVLGRALIQHALAAQGVHASQVGL